MLSQHLMGRDVVYIPVKPLSGGGGEGGRGREGEEGEGEEREGDIILHDIIASIVYLHT